MRCRGNSNSSVAALCLKDRAGVSLYTDASLVYTQYNRMNQRQEVSLTARAQIMHSSGSNKCSNFGCTYPQQIRDLAFVFLQCCSIQKLMFSCRKHNCKFCFGSKSLDTDFQSPDLYKEHTDE